MGVRTGKDRIRRCAGSVRGESGNGMLLGLLGGILIIMFAGGVLDMGFYYAKYQSARRVVSLPGEEVEQMLALYAYEMDPQGRFSETARRHAAANGWPGDAVTANLQRTRTADDIRISTDVTFSGEYDCMFLTLFGIDSLPVRAEAKTENAWKPGEKLWSPGMPSTEWDPPEAE